MSDNSSTLRQPKSFLARNPSVLIFIAALSFVTLIATVLSLFVVPVFYVVMKTLLGQAEGQADAEVSA